MPSCTIRFYADLNDFLPPDSRFRETTTPIYPPVSVKHVIESLGLPHTEAELILANGRPVRLDYPVVPDDQISVYPWFYSLPVDAAVLLRPPLRPPIRFVADNHLGRLVRYLRLLGIDTSYPRGAGDEELARLAVEEQRVLLTRDRGLLKRKQVTYGRCLRTTDSHGQLRDIITRYSLAGSLAPWTHCLRCNGHLAPVDKAAVRDQLEPKTRLYFDDFRQCGSCRQIYWRGSHIGDLQAMVDEVSGWDRSPPSS